MRFPIQSPRSLFRRSTAKDDAMAGLVLGIESVPDGLASGLLAGVNPVSGMYAYLYGVVGGALFTSTAFMAVQGTGAMAIIIADVDLGSRDDPARALFTLSIMTGVVMIIAGLLRLGSFLRFVSNSVMTGFITAVGINIVLGQLDDFTGYDSEGGNRVSRAFDLVFNFWRIDLATTVVGAVTIALIVWLQRTRLGALGLVVAIVAGSVLAAVLNAFDGDVLQVRDIASVPSGLPLITMPVFRDIPALLLPATSLAFVGLVQGAGVSAGFPNEDGTPGDDSQDFVGQGAGNIFSGLFQGIPVGGSMSASSLAVSGGAKTRASLLFAGLTMALVILFLGPVVEFVAMPALAGLLIIVGIGTVKPSRVISVGRTGKVPLTVMTITLVLTMLIPLQFAVVVGVGISVILFVVQQSSRLVVKRMVILDDGNIEEIDPPSDLPPGEVVVIHPYGAIFFATTPTLMAELPTITPDSRRSVVILRLRGIDGAGATILDALSTYADELRALDSKLVIVTDNQLVVRQMRVTGALEPIGENNVYLSTSLLGQTVRRAHDDAVEWVRSRAGGDDEPGVADDEEEAER